MLIHKTLQNLEISISMVLMLAHIKIIYLIDLYFNKEELLK